MQREVPRIIIIFLSDTTNFSLSLSNAGVPQHTSTVYIRNGEDAVDAESLEAAGKHYDVFAEVFILKIRYFEFSEKVMSERRCTLLIAVRQSPKQNCVKYRRCRTNFGPIFSRIR